MAKVKAPKKIFLDANVVIGMGKPPGGPLMTRLVELVKARFIEIITTDLSITEVAKKHAENDYEVVKEIGRPHFRNIVSNIFHVELPNKSKPEIRLDVLKSYQAANERMFETLDADVLKMDLVKPSSEFQYYSEKSGIFSGEAKKDQFPDAFILKCLKAEATEDDPITIISDDSDFDGVDEREEFIELLKSIPELFTDLGLEVEPPEIESFFEENKDRLIELIDKELSDTGLMVSDVEDADIEESTVTDVVIEDFAAFAPLRKGESVVVVGAAIVTATVSFSHPDWDMAMYDSEDKVLIPFDTVSGEKDVELEVEFSMSLLTDDDGDIEQIEEFRFRKDNFLSVELRPSEDFR